MCLNLELFFFRVSSLAYPNLLGKKGYVVIVVVVVVVVVRSFFILLLDWSKVVLLKYYSNCI